MTALDVLLLSNGPAALDGVTADLEAAGHRVVRCHPVGSTSAWPCVALVGGSCPLDGAGVDVALDVRTAVSSGTSPWEDGVACARRDGLPLVVAGRTAFQPFADHASVVVEGIADVVPTVETAAERSRALAEADIEALCGAPVTMSRMGGHVHVQVHVPTGSPRDRSMIATRAAVAARTASPKASHLTVSLD